MDWFTFETKAGQDADRMTRIYFTRRVTNSVTIDPRYLEEIQLMGHELKTLEWREKSQALPGGALILSVEEDQQVVWVNPFVTWSIITNVLPRERWAEVLGEANMPLDWNSNEPATGGYAAAAAAGEWVENIVLWFTTTTTELKSRQPNQMLPNGAVLKEITAAEQKLWVAHSAQ